MPPRPHHITNMGDALREAKRLLEAEFGEADQDAAVELATFLFACAERVEFLEREGERPESAAYGAP